LNISRAIAAITLALLSTVSTLCAAQPGLKMNAAAQALVDEGNVLGAQGKLQQALDKYSQANKADPSSSVPLSQIAEVLRQAAEQAQGEQQAKLRQQAEALVNQILQKYPDEPLAHEVQRKLREDQPPPLHTANAAALAEMNLGEVAFAKQKFDDALLHYERAAALDPQLSMAWIYAADCFYAQKKYAEAETRYRKGVEIEPLNAQGWRYLSDALAFQDKRSAAEDALFSGIAAQPSQIPSWIKLSHLRDAAGYPLTSLNLVRKSSASLGADGKPTVQLDPALSDASKTADGALWLLLGVKQANDMVAQKEGKGDANTLAAETARWRMGFKVAEEVTAKGEPGLQAPALKTLQMLENDGELETALLLLTYRESWRPALEAWKRDNPQGIRKFVDKYGLRP
jgi:tetratricopeptide (TPR) repeat protein